MLILKKKDLEIQWNNVRRYPSMILYANEFVSIRVSRRLLGAMRVLQFVLRRSLMRERISSRTMVRAPVLRSI